MHIVIAPDKFKGSLSAQEVSEAIEAGIKRFDPSIKTTLLPMADGGEGSLDIIARYKDETKKVSMLVKDPIGRTIESSYLLDHNTAFIELAAASGLLLLEREEQNPLLTTTYGTGELILDAIYNGAENIYLFVGGSATNDMGIGMAEVLGYRFVDKDNEQVPPVGISLPFITKIESDLKFDKEKISFYAVCDVQNPLYGKQGAAYVYAMQKGATEDDIILLDRGLRTLSKRCRKYLNKHVADLPGAGAAGGFGGGVLAFLDGQIISGTDFMIDLTEYDRHLETADLVITGEGKIDEQTFYGKTIAGVTKRANRKKIPVVAIAGISEVSEFQMKENGILKIETIIDQAKDLKDAQLNAKKYIEEITKGLLEEYFAKN